MTAQKWFITGSSRGFGRELARAALEAGDRVVATPRKPEQLADLVAEHGDRVLPVALDVTDAAAATAAFEIALERFGRVDVVVNNAGYANVAPIETATEDDFRRQFATNFWGVYHISKAALPVLKRQGGGTIVQFSSIGGRVGHTAGLGSYQAAKFAVDGFTRILVAETEPFGIRHLVVEPGGFAGVVDTEMTQADPEGTRKVADSGIPLGRVGTGDEIARAVAFLLSEEVSYVNGAHLAVDGGFLA